MGNPHSNMDDPQLNMDDPHLNMDDPHLNMDDPRLKMGNPQPNMLIPFGHIAFRLRGLGLKKTERAEEGSRTAALLSGLPLSPCSTSG